MCPPVLAQAGDDTRIHLVLPSSGLLSFLPCTAQELGSQGECQEDMGEAVLSFPRTHVEQLPASTLWSNQSTNLG